MVNPLKNKQPVKMIFLITIGMGIILVLFGTFMVKSFNNTVIQRDKLLIIQSRFLTEMANQQIDAGNYRLGALLAIEALPNYREKEFKRRPLEFGAYKALYSVLGKPIERVRLEGHTDAITVPVFSSDGKRVLTGSADRTARIWSAENGKELLLLSGPYRSVQHAVFGYDGKMVITQSASNSILRWDASTGELLTEMGGGNRLNYHAVQISKDGSRAVAVFQDGVPYLLNTLTGKKLVNFSAYLDLARVIVLSPDGQRVVVGFDEVHLLESDTGNELATFNTPPKYRFSRFVLPAFSGDSKRIAFRYGRDVWVIDALTGEKIIVFDAFNEKFIEFLRLSSDGKILVVGTADAIQFMNVETGVEIFSKRWWDKGSLSDGVFSPDDKLFVAVYGKESFILDTGNGEVRGMLRGAGKSDIITGVNFNPDGTHVVSNSSNHTAHIWDITQVKASLVLTKEKDAESYFGPDGTRGIVKSRKKPLELWDTEKSQKIAILAGSVGLNDSDPFSPDGKRIITTSNDNTIRILSSLTGQELLVIDAGDDDLFQVYFSGNGRHILKLSQGECNLLDSFTGKKILAFNEKSFNLDDLTALVFSSDAKNYITGDSNGVVKMQDFASHKEVAFFSGHADRISHIAFSNDEKYLATSSDDKTARIWDIESGEVLVTLGGHKKGVEQTIFSPDDKRIITVDRSGEARLWDVQSGSPLAEYNAHHHGIKKVAFSPDGKRISILHYSGKLRIWPNYSAEELTEHFNRLNLPPLTQAERRAAFLD